jgi:hypothetical protein
MRGTPRRYSIHVNGPWGITFASVGRQSAARRFGAIPLKEKAVTKNPSTELHVRRPLNRAPTHPGEFFREILEEHLRLSISGR